MKYIKNLTAETCYPHNRATSSQYSSKKAQKYHVNKNESSFGYSPIQINKINPNDKFDRDKIESIKEKINKCTSLFSFPEYDFTNIEIEQKTIILNEIANFTECAIQQHLELLDPLLNLIKINCFRSYKFLKKPSNISLSMDIPDEEDVIVEP